MEETEDANPETRERAPVGVRITIGLLNVFYTGLIIAVFAAAAWGLSSLLLVAAADLKAPASLGNAVAVLSVCLPVFGTMRGTYWMEHFLSARYPSQGKSPGEPPHPLRTIVLPLLYVASTYSVIAVLLWFLVLILSTRDPGWIWPLFWLGFWAVCYATIQWIRRKTPLWIRASAVWIGNKDRRM